MGLEFSVVHVTSGRVRIQTPALRREAGLVARLIESLPKNPGILEAEANSDSGSITIRFDPGRWTHERILDSIASFDPEPSSAQASWHADLPRSPDAGPQKPNIPFASPKLVVASRFIAAALRVDPDTLSPQQLEDWLGIKSESRAVPQPAGPEAGAPPAQRLVPPASTLGCPAVVHALPDRVRLRVQALRFMPGLADPLARYLASQPDIREVGVTQGAASVTIRFDPSAWTAETLCTRIRTLSAEELLSFQPNGSHRKGRGADPPESAGYALALATTGMALHFVADALASPLTLVLLVGSALPMLNRAYLAFARQNTLTVDMLDASATALLTVQGKLPMAMFVVWLVNLGDFIRDATVTQAQKAVEEVLSYRRYPAWVVRNGEKVRVTVDEIQVGETVVVYPGERIPVDGIVTAGSALVDQQALTGESMPVKKQEGDFVYAATVVRDGKVYLRAEHIGDETEAAKIVHLIEDAPAQETRAQNYAERWANGLVPYSFLGAGLSALAAGNLCSAVSILIIDYGSGIRIAAPTTVLAAMTKAIRHGILIKGGRYLEELAGVDAVVFDKTGTLTQGKPEVLDVIVYGGNTADTVLALAAAAEQRLTHPVAQAIVRAATARRIPIPDRSSSDYTIGLGVEAQINDVAVLTGCPRFMELKQVSIPDDVKVDLADLDRRAVSPICVAVEGALIGLLTYADPLRPESPEVVRYLRELGVKEIIMLTGDHGGVARAVADQVGISRFVSGVLPWQKVEVVQRLQSEGYTVAVVGDGINDSPALAHAEVGIAIDGGADAAQATAQVVLLNGGLWKIPLAIEISREAVHLIQQNWTLISVPNTIALILACFGWVGPGPTTLLSNGSTILATGNALRPLLESRTGAALTAARESRVPRRPR